jgi:CDP-4-dehydro-6-deoxyglucose reductase, E3
LLAAAEAASIRLPHSCRSGRCSSCKCRIDGPSVTTSDELGLSKAERSGGWSLACVRVATGSVTLSIEDLTDLKLPASRIVPSKVDSLENLSPDVLRVRLRLPPGTSFAFAPGQYVDVLGPGGIRRSYSLAKRADGGAIELHIRRVDGGAMSDYWFGRVKLNDLLRVDGPRGTFTLRSDPQTDVVFLATGTGIAPVKAMLEEIASLAPKNRPRSVRLFWGGRHRDDLYWDPREALEDVIYVPTLSRAEAGWQGRQGYVQDVALAAGANLDATQVYACGSDAMIRGARAAFERAGLPERAFFSDAFVASN